MRNSIILFDIDHTLFNTEKYKEQAFANVSKVFPKISEQEVRKIEEDVYIKMREVGVFHPVRFAKSLISRLRKKEKLHGIVAILEDKNLIESCMYADVREVLESLQREGFRLGIFSSGDTQLQRKKINELRHFFSQVDVHIYPLKDIEIPHILSQYNAMQVIVVDDILRVLEEVDRENKDVVKVWINRRKQIYQNGDANHFKPHYTIHTLAEMEDIVKDLTK